MKKMCWNMGGLDDAGNMTLGDCTKDRCELWDKEHICCILKSASLATMQIAKLLNRVVENTAGEGGTGSILIKEVQ